MDELLKLIHAVTGTFRGDILYVELPGNKKIVLRVSATNSNIITACLRIKEKVYSDPSWTRNLPDLKKLMTDWAQSGEINIPTEIVDFFFQQVLEKEEAF
jgi:hypothetical protein